jgi:hypothetical protein
MNCWMIYAAENSAVEVSKKELFVSDCFLFRVGLQSTLIKFRIVLNNMLYYQYSFGAFQDRKKRFIRFTVTLQVVLWIASFAPN